MAKNFNLKITKSDFNGIIANQEFAPLVTTNQVGDKFYVPEESNLLVLGTGINARDAEGNERIDDAGNPIRRQVGQHFCVVRLIDNKPVDVRELFVGQLVKVDINRKLVFPGVLSDALQLGDVKFKETICGEVLEIVSEGTCMDRVWDNQQMRWKRNEDGTLASTEKRVLHFEPKRNAMRPEDIERANEMLMEYYLERYKDYVEVEE